MSNISWGQYFMSLVYLVAMKSKDTSTKIGAVVVGPDKEIRSTGYNSFPRGINDDVPERHERPEKYYWFAHAERNAIYNAARMGISLKGCRMYTNGVPCMDCAVAVIQSGITEVVVDKNWGVSGVQWEETCGRTLELFEEAGVSVYFYEGDFITEIKGLRSGEPYELTAAS